MKNEKCPHGFLFGQCEEFRCDQKTEPKGVDLEKLKELLKKSTPSPWRYSQSVVEEDKFFIEFYSDEFGEWHGLWDEDGTTYELEDMELIAFLRNKSLDMVFEIEFLREQTKALLVVRNAAKVCAEDREANSANCMYRVLALKRAPSDGMEK